MTVKALSPPMLELEAMIAAKKIVHNGNPVMNWCMSNVVARYDSNSNVYPRKTRNVNKIDGAVALIMAVSRSMVVTEVQEAWTPFFA
jgi:phage terminase large subunit-like protein